MARCAVRGERQFHGDAADAPSGVNAHAVAPSVLGSVERQRRGDGLHEMLRAAQELGPDDIRALGLYLARIPPRPAPAGH